MNQKGFTLIEVLVVVLILGVLVTIALPKYIRTVERARATEAMTAIKAMNDAIYAFYEARETCPVRFSQLVVALPSRSTSAGGAFLSTQFFNFYLSGAASGPVETSVVPGTDCRGVLAQRTGVDKFDYVLYNPFTRGNTGKSQALVCMSPGDKEASKDLCDSLGLLNE